MPGKKNFKSANPALSFIDSHSTSRPDVDYTHTDQHTHTDLSTYTHSLDQDHSAAASLPLVSPAENTVPSYSHSKRESKSRRLQLLIKPSVHAQLADIARLNDTSVNDTINTVLEEYLRKERI